MRINVSLKKRQYQRILRRNDIKLVYYLNQDDILLDGVPFISTIWDIGYFSTFPFPELASGRNFEGRYRRLRYDLQKALMVFVESEAGKRDLTQFAGIAPCRIRVVPIFAGNVTFLNVPDIDQNAAMERFGLSKYHYFFYPAQFWAHKNHIAVIEAFSLLVQRHPDYKLVFCGSDKGNIEYIKRVAISSSAASQIVFLGFVSNEEMNALYRNATALVMSSYFGPTNMPPIEAMMLSCPVICTDLDGHREILEDAALYFSAMDYIDLLDKMEIMVENRDTYVSLIQKRKTESPFTIEHAIECISRNLCEASVIRSTWD